MLGLAYLYVIKALYTVAIKNLVASLTFLGKIDLF